MSREKVCAIKVPLYDRKPDDFSGFVNDWTNGRLSTHLKNAVLLLVMIAVFHKKKDFSKEQNRTH